jgi:hypothetical protein
MSGRSLPRAGNRPDPAGPTRELALAGARVVAPNIPALTFELKASLARENGWALISRRNHWFQKQAVGQLARNHNGNHTVFAYSYAAKEIFEFARARGWRTVLGQIDPGPAEERIVAGLQSQVLRLFDTFGYARLGLSCRLANNVCRMGGLDSSGAGYTIVEGSGLPRITVIGHQEKVDWPVLVARLKAATDGQTPIIE